MSLEYDLSSFIPHVHSGKVRETYAIPGHSDKLLVAATDRVSTHNLVHRSLIPGKGEILTALTVFWLTVGPLREFPHHLVAAGQCIYAYLPAAIRERFPDLHYRAIVVWKLDMVPVEFIYRSRLTGSLLKKYKEDEDPYGLDLPPGLTEMSPFPTGTVFTPTRKSKNDPSRKWRNTVRQFPGESLLTARAYAVAETYLASVGITLIDSKLEAGEEVLGDELFTTDSSRFVYAHQVTEGVAPPWLDKQVLRDIAEQVWAGGKKYPLIFSEDAIMKTVANLNEVLGVITQANLETWQHEELYDFDIRDAA